MDVARQRLKAFFYKKKPPVVNVAESPVGSLKSVSPNVVQSPRLSRSKSLSPQSPKEMHDSSTMRMLRPPDRSSSEDVMVSSTSKGSQLQELPPRANTLRLSDELNHLMGRNRTGKKKRRTRMRFE